MGVDPQVYEVARSRVEALIAQLPADHPLHDGTVAAVTVLIHRAARAIDAAIEDEIDAIRQEVTTCD